MACYLKIVHITTLILILHQTSSTTLTQVLLPDLTLIPISPLIRLPRDIKYPRDEKYSGYATDNSDKNQKPEDSSDRDVGSTPPDKRCISCVSSVLEKNPSYDRNRYYDDNRPRDYDRYDDRDRYFEKDRYNDRDRYYDRYDRYSDRDRIYRGRDRYTDPYDYERGYEPYDRYDRYNSRDRDRHEPYERNDRYNDRGIGYDNRGYDYRGYDNRYDAYPSRSYDDTYRTSSPGAGYAGRWNYGNSDSGRDDYYNRDRYLGYRPVSKDPIRDPLKDTAREPYNDTYRPTSYLYGRPSSTTLKPPNSEGSNTPAPQENSG